MTTNGNPPTSSRVRNGCPVLCMCCFIKHWSGDTMPVSHLPLLLKPEGKVEAQQTWWKSNSVSLYSLWEWHDPKNREYLWIPWQLFPSESLTFLALLGWNQGTEQVPYSRRARKKLSTLVSVLWADGRLSRKEYGSTTSISSKENDKEIAELFAPIVANNSVDGVNGSHYASPFTWWKTG